MSKAEFSYFRKLRSRGERITCLEIEPRLEYRDEKTRRSYVDIQGSTGIRNARVFLTSADA